VKRSCDDSTYDELGRGYAKVRRADPRIAARIDAAPGDALESGAWEERYGHLRQQAELEVGLRIVIGPAKAPAR
jgi:hypothetical protein